MEEPKSPVDVAARPDRIDKSAPDVEAEQKEKEKYQSQPEGKVKFGDYLVRIHNQSLLMVETNLYLASSGFSHMPPNGTLYYYYLDLLPPLGPE
jgi:hypothetical protein